MTSPALFRAERLLALGAPAGPVLGLDTGTPTATLGLVGQGRRLGGLARAADSRGASLPAAVQELLGSACLTLREVSAIAVGIGPGSFTGLRVGLSYAKGVVLANGCQIVGVPTLDSMALCALEMLGAGPGTVICPVLDARKGEAYAALYRVTEDGLEKLSADSVVTPRELLANVAGPATFVGEAVAAYGRSLIDAMGGRANILDLSEFHSRGLWVAALGAARVAARVVDPVMGLEPLYVRPPEAALKASRTRGEAHVRTEALWSAERKNLSGNTQDTMRS